MYKLHKIGARSILLLTILFSSVCASQAYAASYGTAGCGLGSILFENTGTWWKQVLAATTNGTFGNQTFGITSGTSNCGSGATALARKQQDYVTANLVSLQREVAQGSGDAVVGLADVFGCKANDYSKFAEFSQTNYKAIFNSNDPVAIISNIKIEINKNSNLTQSCEYAQI
ncbi:DUF3015 family protein [Fluviispira sanaruensis]|uniref:DUF3015 domain-containing protein n=1 Tax=Fluviispira sanaruensis TaxID=2493639 RepID=A0A4V0P2J5_FLUSA|nr:DUF3015 family protein [Fluviispira sanaruensis]BBH53447.1 DUF3015 domain-containing protein [Fluviispira sanaruensis]